MQTLKWVVPVQACALLIASAHGDLIMFDNLHEAIPDGYDTHGALVDTRTINLNFHSIGCVDVWLNIVGTESGSAYNGDLYVYLLHGSGFSVLLNRVGRDSGNSLGYDDSGFNVQLSDSATQGDIHQYQATLGRSLGNDPLTGIWAPDGRNVDPDDVVSSDPRKSMLSSFNGVDPNGPWVLFVADLNEGGTATLDNWGLNIAEGSASFTVPESFNAPAGLGTVLLLLAAQARWQRARRLQASSGCFSCGPNT